MNAINHDYLDLLRQAAQAFVSRHQAEHLQDEERLFKRGVTHLMLSHNASQAQAENAMGQALPEGRQQQLNQLAIKQAINFIQRIGRQSSAQVLCSTTAQYIAGLYDLPIARAEDIAAIAYATLNPSHLYLDMERSTPEVIRLTDPVRNISYVVTVASIATQMISNPSRRRLHPVH